MLYLSKDINLFQGDCLEVMDKLIEQGVLVDSIITDPPYGTTACKWDSIIPFEDMWLRLNKLIKPNGAIVLFGSETFSSALRMSNIKKYKYDCVWEKTRVSGFTNAKNKPLNTTENISFFSNGVTANTKNVERKMQYYPQGLVRIDRPMKNTSRGADSTVGNRPSRVGDYTQEFTNYPKNILKFSSESKPVHPTQKPVELMEYLIKTYTNECETVLDFTMGSGTTGVACNNLNRKFIGIELDENYFNIAKERIDKS